jgi:hypothetical protein
VLPLEQAWGGGLLQHNFPGPMQASRTSWHLHTKSGGCIHCFLRSIDVCRVGQGHIYIRCINGMYCKDFIKSHGHIRRLYTVMANPKYMSVKGKRGLLDILGFTRRID